MPHHLPFKKTPTSSHYESLFFLQLKVSGKTKMLTFEGLRINKNMFFDIMCLV